MSDQPIPEPDDQDKLKNVYDTLPVPPPSFRERLLAAQKARANEIRPSVTIPVPARQTDEDAIEPEDAATE
jgi:hypothetical protein